MDVNGVLDETFHFLLDNLDERHCLAIGFSQPAEIEAFEKPWTVLTPAPVDPLGLQS